MPSKQVTIQGVLTWEEGSLPGEPPSIWPSPGHPAHPIAPTPPGIWGGGNVPMPSPPIYLPPGSLGPGVPAHPIVIPTPPPPGIWPSPGHPAHPIQPVPPGQPPGIWGPPGPWPTPPIHLPPTGGDGGGGQPPGVWPPGSGIDMLSQPISGGGYIIGWHPALGYVWMPLGGASGPPGGGNGGGGGEHPAHPIELPPEDGSTPSPDQPHPSPPIATPPGPAPTGRR